MSLPIKHALITGPPGVGKTTLIKKICEKLKTKNLEISGFYTEELRNANSRIGFDVITLNGNKAKLARTADQVQTPSKYKVGQYHVFPNEFEQLVMPLLRDVKQILVIDEVGKMELLSDVFKKEIESVFKKSQIPILATVPIQKGRPIPTVEAIKALPNCKIFLVDKSNRNGLADEITLYLTSQ